MLTHLSREEVIMNKKLLLSIVLGGLLSPTTIFANDKVASVYHPQTFQKVCKGKSQGDWVEFAYRGIIWNGSCQPQFFSSDKNALIYGDEPELLNICRQDAQAKTVTLEGRSYNGKCALAFTPPRPQAGNR